MTENWPLCPPTFTFVFFLNKTLTGIIYKKSVLNSFGFLLGPFGFLLGPFGSFWVPLGPFGSFWVNRRAGGGRVVSSLLAEQEDRVRFPASPLEFSEIGYLLLPSRDMAERSLNRRESSKQPTNQLRQFTSKWHVNCQMIIFLVVLMSWVA